MAKGNGKGKLGKFIERHQDTINFLIAVALLLAVVIVFSLIRIYFEQPDRGEVVARVNGEAIYESQLNQRYNDLPSRQQQTYTKEMVLDQMIQEVLLLQRIDEIGLEATDSEIREARQEMMRNNALDEESLDQILKMQGMSQSDLNQVLERQILLNKLLEREMDVNVTEEEMREYYANNLQEFLIPAQVTVQQAIVPENRTNSRVAAEAILEEARNNGWTGFCDIVSQYVQQNESACGTYNITRESGLPDEFVNTSFEMEVGGAKIIKTSYGWHVMHKRAFKEQGVQTYRQARERIRTALESSEQRQAYRLYIRQLRENATIENYLLEELVRNVTQERETTPSFENLTACITDDAVLYGARWDSRTQEQIALFGNQSEEIRYVECSLPDTLEEQREVCEEAGIQGYPTWRIDGKSHPGLQSIDRLATLTGCAQ